jgi:hypothetical protein
MQVDGMRTRARYFSVHNRTLLHREQKLVCELNEIGSSKTPPYHHTLASDSFHLQEPRYRGQRFVQACSPRNNDS